MGFIRAYSAWAERLPLFSAFSTTGVIFGLGDVMTQMIVEKRKDRNERNSKTIPVPDACKEYTSAKTITVNTDIDKLRLFNVWLYCTGLLGPGLGLWYTRCLPWLVKSATSHKKKIAMMVGYDQLIESSAMDGSFLYCLHFLDSSWATYFETNSTDAVVAKAQMNASAAWRHTKESFLPVYLMDCCVWPWVQIINFSVMPAHMQTPVVSCVSVFWSAYLSFKNQAAQAGE
eukprot:gnl/TRDRNA2_/TRDRNA2_41917_c0_seq2.p1 gnl/TRDRNA2_/TRDRNA2_41917_c0~~gnl/TRDRNA2_/TRDRNA2_41917_c0_seq2.p1  ORF type:complete len:230 (+),score=21.17 gnl/TRDRNA2_/TRDRNA2_41917_c0_seq2:33-722(+)